MASKERRHRHTFESSSNSGDTYELESVPYVDETTKM